MKKFFGEHVTFLESSKEEREEAKEYLRLWKKFFMRKLQRDSYRVEEIGHEWIERPSNVVGSLCQYAALALKIEVEGKYFYDLENQTFN